MIKIPTDEVSMPHISSKGLVGDIWFYRPECRYLNEAWLEHPRDFDPARLIDNTELGTYVRAAGHFSIPASFYLAPPDKPGEYASFRHFNAVDANICFNQLAYVLLLEGASKGLIPLSMFGVDTDRLRRRRVTVNMMIGKISTTFVRRIDPADFTGWIAVTNMYLRKGMPFIDLEFQFEDSLGGLAVGTCRGVLFVQNLDSSMILENLVAAGGTRPSSKAATTRV
jgi:hypothetical protein